MWLFFPWLDETWKYTVIFTGKWSNGIVVIFGNINIRDQRESYLEKTSCLRSHHPLKNFFLIFFRFVSWSFFYFGDQKKWKGVDLLEELITLTCDKWSIEVWYYYLYQVFSLWLQVLLYFDAVLLHLMISLISCYGQRNINCVKDNPMTQIKFEIMETLALAIWNTRRTSRIMQFWNVHRRQNKSIQKQIQTKYHLSFFEFNFPSLPSVFEVMIPKAVFGLGLY